MQRLPCKQLGVPFPPLPIFFMDCSPPLLVHSSKIASNVHEVTKKCIFDVDNPSICKRCIKFDLPCHFKLSLQGGCNNLMGGKYLMIACSSIVQATIKTTMIVCHPVGEVRSIQQLHQSPLVQALMMTTKIVAHIPPPTG